MAQESVCRQQPSESKVAKKSHTLKETAPCAQDIQDLDILVDLVQKESIPIHFNQTQMNEAKNAIKEKKIAFTLDLPQNMTATQLIDIFDQLDLDSSKIIDMYQKSAMFVRSILLQHSNNLKNKKNVNQ